MRSYDLYKTTPDAWKAMIESCANARKSIDCEQYILSNDTAGHALLDVLLKKQQEGVRVRLLCDWVGSYDLYFSGYPKRLREAGAEVRFFNRLNPILLHRIFTFFFRTHRKILIVDESIGFTGGVGFRDEFRTWRDTHVRVTGAVVPKMASAFEKLWKLSADRKFLYKLKALKTTKSSHVFIENAPYFKKRFMYYELIRRIRDAKTSVKLTTPYLVPDARLLRSLVLAVRRGVDVSIITPTQSDNRAVDLAKHSFYRTLLYAGITLFEYTPSMIHAKTAIIDGSWASIGSFNLDNLSFSYNFEASVATRDKHLIGELEHQFKNDSSTSNHITTKSWNTRSVAARMKEILIIPLRRFL